MTIPETLTLIFAAAGVLVMLLSSIGLLRLRDVLARTHAAGLTTSLGVSLVLIAAGILFWDRQLLWRIVVLIGLLYLTGPVATTAIGRAIYLTTRKIDHNLWRDDMAGHRRVPNGEQPAPGSAGKKKQVRPQGNPARSG